MLELIIANNQLNINILNSQKLDTIRDQTFFKKMKQLLITIAALVLVGCGPSVPDIHKAAIIGDIEAVKQYLDAGGDVNAKDEATTTPLYWAASYGHKEIVELLIANGEDVNLRSGMVVKTEDGSPSLTSAGSHTPRAKKPVAAC